jgi:prolipoprotein diacylglyceryltransferase
LWPSVGPEAAAIFPVSLDGVFEVIILRHGRKIILFVRLAISGAVLVLQRWEGKECELLQMTAHVFDVWLEPYNGMRAHGALVGGIIGRWPLAKGCNCVELLLKGIWHVLVTEVLSEFEG